MILRLLLLVLASLATIGCAGESTLTTSEVSPDGTVEARLLDEPRNAVKIDRNFSVQIVDLRSQEVNVVLERSSDQAGPGERFLWSQDGRYLLLLGKGLLTKPKWKTQNGEFLYLLYDRESAERKLNGWSPEKSESFGPEELKDIDFGEELLVTEPKEKR